jgi:hypothetical protein
MRYGRLLLLDLKAVFRGLIPSPVVRAALVATLAGAALFVSVVMVLGAGAEGRSPTAPRAVLPVTLFMVGFGLMVGVPAAARVQAREAAGSVWRLAPLPPVAATFVPLGSAALLALAGASVVGLPVLLAAAAARDGNVALAAAMTLLAAAWSSVLSVLIVARCRHAGGDALVEKVAAAAPTAIGIGLVVGSRWIAQLRFEAAVAAVLLTAAVVLPWLAHVTAARWIAGLANGAARAAAPEPAWGSPGWLHLLANRTPFAWALPGFILLAFASPADMIVAVQAGFAILPMAGLTHLMRWEHERPERARLSPAGHGHYLRMLVAVAGPLALVAIGGLALVTGNAPEFAALTGLALIAPLTALLSQPVVRTVAQAAAFALALAAAVAF